MLPDSLPSQPTPLDLVPSDPTSRTLTPNKDVIHVTLEAASMKQLIKLSQEIMQHEQLQRDISMPEFNADS